MTTIAYKKGVVACDKQGTWYNQGMQAPFKAIATDDVVYLVTGELVEGLRFVNYLQEGSKKPPKLKNATVYEFNKKSGKLCVWECNYISLPVIERVWADGSGGQIALGAMAFGASPEEAVKIATKYDIYTGGGVQSWTSDKAK